MSEGDVSFKRGLQPPAGFGFRISGFGFLSDLGLRTSDFQRTVASRNRPEYPCPVSNGTPASTNSYRKIRVFAALPGDVAEERQRLAKVVSHLNDQLADATGIRLELKEWRQVAPGMGRPEDVILDQLSVATWDVFIGLLWLRFGMPPGRNHAGENHDSGTEEEFRLAYRARQERQRPRILFYRCTRPAPVSVDTEQLSNVQRFFDEFAPDGQNPGLFQDFGKASEFEKMVEKHLTELMLEEYQASALPPRMRAAPERGCPQPQQPGTVPVARPAPRVRPAHFSAGEDARPRAPGMALGWGGGSPPLCGEESCGIEP